MRSEITEILLDARTSADSGATERLAEALCPELRRLAQGLMRRERPGHTLAGRSLSGKSLACTSVEADIHFNMDDAAAPTGNNRWRNRRLQCLTPFSRKV
jgi:hypothetical protein